MGLRSYLDVLRGRWPAVLIFTLVGFAIAGVYCLLAPRVYTAQAEGFVALGSTDSAAPTASATLGLQRVKTYTRFVDSPEVLQRAIADLHLDTTTVELAKRVSAANPQQTLSLVVSADGDTPEEPALVANAVLTELGKQIETFETPPGAKDSTVRVSIVKPAESPSPKTSPDTLIDLVVGLIAGLALGVTYALVRDAMDNTITSREVLAELTDVKTLGLIPFDPTAKRHPVLGGASRSGRAEGLRTVRTTLLFSEGATPPRAIVITSATSGEGKTTTACNLAVVMAKAGNKVLLVEADLRRPRAANYLGLSSAPGLADILLGTCTVADATSRWGRGMFSFIGAGTLPSNPSELLASEQMADLIDEWLEEYDTVLLDAPPLLSVADAAGLAPATDGAVLVVRYGTVSEARVDSAVGALEATGGVLLGAVLNCVPEREMGGYGYGYQETAEDSTDEASAAVRPARGGRRSAQGHG